MRLFATHHLFLPRYPDLSGWVHVMTPSQSPPNLNKEDLYVNHLCDESTTEEISGNASTGGELQKIGSSGSSPTFLLHDNREGEGCFPREKKLPRVETGYS